MKNENLESSFIRVCVVLILSLVGSGFSQVYVNGEKRNLAVTLYDWPETSPDFGTNGGACGGGLRQGYVAKKLDAEGKPAIGPATCTPTDLVQWFRSQKVAGYSNATCYDLGITYDGKGLWVADYPRFFPMDDFTHLDEAKTVVNPWNKKTSHNSSHNYSFTMEIDAEFDYKKGQTFDFRGDDDVFVFINNELVVDIGGVHGALPGKVSLDTLGLVEGTNYSFKIFFAERQEVGSSFKMATSMDLKTKRELIIQTIKNGNTTRYDVNERQANSNESCSSKNANAAIVIAPSDFKLHGNTMVEKQLDIGLSYGGILITDNSASVSIDLDAIVNSKQLEAGLYEIVISHKNDASQTDTIEFKIEYDIEDDVVADSCINDTCDSPRLLHAKIYDLKPDGIAETIKIKFDTTVKNLKGVYSIDWPVEGANNLSSTFANTTYGKLETGGVDSTTLILDMSSHFGKATEADSLKPPYLNFGKDSVLIEDKMGPIILEASKAYPKEPRYAVLLESGEYEYFESPITLTVTSSEAIVFGDSLNDSFIYKGFNNDSMRLELLELPRALDDKYSTSLVMSDSMKTKSNEMIFLSFSSNFSVNDIHGNPAVVYFVKIQELQATKPKNISHAFREAIVGEEKQSTTSLVGGTIKLYDGEGEYIKRISENSEISTDWVPPYNFKEGNFDSDSPCVDRAILEKFPSSCLASLALGSFKEAGAYKSKVFIYDHLGQFVNSWEQSYGYCGEFENLDRISMSEKKNYHIQDLIWNLKNYDGRSVGGGVYFWKINIQFESGKSYELFKQMGVVKASSQCDENK
ncbi:fibro-slime domain-containing protein [Fibrobacterales bacterium]|nr:fibro-slime domain-containing protein [Fibrobacterales bacterium]